MPDRLKVKLGSLALDSPIIAASGCYGYGIEYAELEDSDHLGGLITKSISLAPWAGNPPPRMAETGDGLLNSIGLPNIGVEAFLEEIMPVLESYSTRVIVSVACKVMEEYAQVVERLEAAEGIDGYELNVSCPNVKEGGMAFGQNPVITEELVRKVRYRTGRWIAVKLTPNVASVAEGARAAEAGGADAVSLINTVVGMVVDYRSRRPKIATITGGYSGPPIKPIALAKVWEVAGAVKIPVIGIGGICTWEDVVEFMIVGASAVQIGTALFTDPALPRKLNDSLVAYLNQENVNNIGEITGTLRTDRAYMAGVPD